MAAMRFWSTLAARLMSRPLKARIKTVRIHSGIIAVFALDATIVVYSACCAYSLELQSARRVAAGAGAAALYLPLASILAFVALLACISWRANPSPSERLRVLLRDQLGSLLASLAAGAALFAAYCTAGSDNFPHGLVMSTIVASLIVLSARRLLQSKWTSEEDGTPLRNAVIIGMGDEAQAVRHQMQRFRRLRYRFSGFVDATPHGRHSQFSPDAVADIYTLFHERRLCGVDEIFVTSPYDQRLMERILPDARRAGVDMRIAPEAGSGADWSRGAAPFSQFLALPLHRAKLNRPARAQKRAFDVIFSAFALLLLGVPMLVIALLIKIDSPGPVFYRSRRVGRGRRIFQCTKFRTMTHNPFAQDEARITRIGRFLRAFSLQELPQILDVLRGNMSLVGPRPPMASDAQNCPGDHLRRLEVTPGITGLWQVQAGEPDTYVSLDRTYIENWSLWLDLRILIRTLAGVLSAN